MPPGRNDPCPCGSAVKYKHCCGKTLGVQTESGPSPNLPPEVLERARAAHTWQADLVAVPVAISGKERSRSVMAMVVAGGMPVQSDARLVTSAEPEDVAGELEAALAEAAAMVGVWPATVVVRRKEVAEGLRPLLQPRGCAVQVAPVLRELDPLAEDLSLHFSGSDTWPVVPPPETWAAWGLPASTVASLFRAYAAFFRARPWRWFDDYPPVLAEWEDGTWPWTVSVMGSGMGEYGLAVYSDAADLEALVEGPMDEVFYDEDDVESFVDDEEEDEPAKRWRENPFRNLQGWVVHMGFIHRQELPRPMVKEISRAQWKVEAVEAYPYISPILTPGGGLQQDLANRLIQLLQGVTALAEKYGSRLRTPEGGIYSWTGEGLTLRYLNPSLEEAGTGPLPPGFEDVMEKIQDGGFASDDEIQSALNRRMNELNAAPQEELAGISPNQAADLMRAGFGETSPLRLSQTVTADELEGSTFLANARAFLDALLETKGAPATAAGNLKRAFVAEMLETMRFEEGYLDDLFRMNKVINEDDVGTLHVLRVNLEVGGLLKRRRGHFSLTRKGKELAKPEQAGHLFTHLFRTYFGEFNITYRSSRTDDSSLQQVVPLLLWQIGARAKAWISLPELALQILPRRRDLPPQDEGAQWWREESDLHWWVLRPLKEFGLLEMRDLRQEDTWGWNPEEIHLRTTPLYEAFLRFEW